MSIFKFIGKKSKKVKREEAIVVSETMNNINECYNSLKDNLIYMCENESTKVIQVESSHSSEGKTTLACNLGVSLSFNQKKVLIMELDFRKPRVNRLFNLSNELGLVDYISEKATFEQIIKKTEYENVEIITRGSPIYNPSFLLTSEKFKSLITKLRDIYDYIILDCPPVLQISDYIHVSKVSDGVLFVVAYGKTKRSAVREATQLLRKDNIRVIGSVMTFVDRYDPYSRYYGSYRYRYGYDSVDES